VVIALISCASCSFLFFFCTAADYESDG
jgi:hypothetical protein